MATGFTPTATYSNLTRLELEALRKADFFAGDKALTVGDAAQGSEGVVGKGDINAEPFYTGSEVALDDILPLTPPQQPGLGIGTQSAVATGAIYAEYAQWLGPTAIYDAAASGFASGANAWDDTTPGFSFIVAGVQVGDILLITPTENVVGVNAGVVATIQTVAANQLAVVNIWNPASSTAALSVSADKYNYTIIRPSALKLFAVPGSGPLGGEQTFLVVRPGSTLHNTAGPTLNAINADRLLNVIPPKFALSTSVDRADWVYDFGGISRSISGSERGLDTLGYRVVLYPDNGLGAPDLTKPITSLNPTIDPAIPAADQRFTIDYKAGVIRFSCAPTTGGDIKPLAGCVSPTTGRLNLYAVLWVVDLSYTEGNARTLYGVRTTPEAYRVPGRVVFNATTGAWEVGTTGVDINAFYVKALGTASGASQTNPYAPVQFSTEFGTVDDTVVPLGSPRYFTYRQGSNVWRFVRSESWFGLGPTDSELTVEDKTKLTLGDISNPAQGYGGDLNPITTWQGTQTQGARDTSEMLGRLPAALLTAPYGVAHLKKGRYYLTDKTIYVPPGSTIQGEGAATKILARVNSSATGEVRPVFKVGPNTPWGVWDASATENLTSPYGVTVSPTTMTTSTTARVEGADLVWNPVRRVWGQVIAVDSGIWFNEIGVDGTYKFSGLGVNVKDTVSSLFTSFSPNSTHHTGNHYPRIAHHEHTDEYSVVWVDQVTVGGTIGPQVFYRAFSVDLDLTATTPTPSLLFKSAGFRVGQAFTFHDHPSIAIEGYTTTGTYRSQVTFWEYTTDAAGLINTGNSGTTRYIYEGGTTFISGSTAWLSAPFVVANPELGIVSSTDTKWDGASRFLAVWSVREHAVITGTNGSLSLYFFDHASAISLQQKGVVPGSKLHILGGATTTFGDAPPFIPATQDSTTLTVQFVAASPATVLTVWHDLNATPFPDAGPLKWAITPSSYVQGAFSDWTAATTFSSAFDVVNGQKGQDDRFYIMELDQPDFVRLSRGGDKWLVVFQGFQATAFLSIPRLKSFQDSAVSPTFYDAAGGIPVADPVVYREHVSTCRVLLADNGSLINPSPPDQVQVTTTARNTGPSAQVYYEMTSGVTTNIAGGTPGVLTDAGATFNADFRNVDSRWGDTKLDGTTWVAIFGGAGINPNFGIWPVTGHTNTTLTINATLTADAVARGYVLYRSPNITDARIARDIEVSAKSLGTRPPLTTRPNFVSTLRSPMNEAREVAAHNFMYRWDGRTPSLMPAVTWTGQDWVVVSPAKNHLHSFTGCYHPSGGTALFADAGWYFGRGSTGSRAAGTLGELVRTFPSGAKIYDVASGIYLSVVSVYDEHTVVLSGGTPLGGADLTNREYHLILPSLPDYGGFKNQGYRVAEDGSIITSTSYITFADPPAADSKSNFHRNRELMRRVFPYYGSPTIANQGTLGANYPAVGVQTDAPEEGSHRKGDIFFNGVAVGRPKGVNEASYLEPPVVALAWGESYFGFLDRIKAGDPASRVQRMEFYRQSFGPYNVTLKDFALDVVDTAGLQVLSRAHIYTNHGSDRTGNVAIATDGYRNVYLYPTKIQAEGWTAPSPEWVRHFSRLHACYTNAEGHHPIHVEASLTAGNNYNMNVYAWQQSPQFQSASMTHSLRYTNQNTTVKVIWDGKRFVAAWVAHLEYNPSTPDGYSPFVLSIGQLPGDEDGGFQTTEMVSPSDIAGNVFPLGSSLLTTGSGGTNAYDFAVTAIDLACSETTYAVVWVAGCVEDVPNFGLGDQLGGSAIGVTIFKLDNAVPDLALFNPSTLLGRTYPGGGQNYVLGQSQMPGTWVNPRIIWTGDKYAIFAQQTNFAPAAPTDYRDGDSYPVVMYCGPDGPAEPVQVKQQIGRHGGFGGFYPVNNYSPLMPTALNGADLLGLGYVYRVGSLLSNFTFQEYTEVILTGGEGEVPIVYAGTSGWASNANTWRDLGANFLTGGFGPVRAGDLLVVSDAASPNRGIYVISDVPSTTSLEVGPSQLSAPFPEVASRDYYIVRPAHPNVQPGDVLEVDGIWLDGFSYVSTQSTGHYPVIGYNPRTRVLTVEGQFDPGDVGTNTTADPYWKYSIRGSLRTGTTANVLLGSVVSAGRAGSTSSAVKTGDASWLTDLLLSGSYSTDPTFTKMASLLDVAYNADRDEFVVLFTSYALGVLYLWVAVYDQRKRQFSAAKPLFSYVGGGTIYFPYNWKLNWNGKHYLAAGSYYQTPTSTGLYMQAFLLSDSLAIEQSITLDPIRTTAGTNDLLGNGSNQLPGKGYDAFAATSTSIGAVAKDIGIVWNNRLARWTISACVSWHTSGWTSTSSNLEPSLISMGTVTAWAAGSALITVSGSTEWLQPGMKVSFRGTIGVTNVYFGYVTVKEVVNLTQFVANATFSEFDTGLGYWAASVPAPQAYILPREDLFTWTLGYSAAGISIDDADGVTIENVTFSGQTADITERWSNMARPIWQAAGQTTGLRWRIPTGGYTATLLPFNYWTRTGFHPHPQYNHRFLVPKGKVETTRVLGLRSNTKLRFDPTGHGPRAKKGEP